MSIVRWEDPPPSRTGQAGEPKHLIAHELIAYQLKQRPGEWALLLESSGIHTLGSLITNGKYAAYRPAGSFEAVTRIIDGRHFIYARYVGGAS